MRGWRRNSLRRRKAKSPVWIKSQLSIFALPDSRSSICRPSPGTVLQPAGAFFFGLNCRPQILPTTRVSGRIVRSLNPENHREGTLACAKRKRAHAIEPSAWGTARSAPLPTLRVRDHGQQQVRRLVAARMDRVGAGVVVGVIVHVGLAAHAV